MIEVCFFKNIKIFGFLVFILSCSETYGCSNSATFLSRWNRPNYHESMEPDLDTVKRIGSLYFAMKKSKKNYSKQEFENDLKYLGFSKDDIRYLKNNRTLTFLNNYVRELSILENGIPDHTIYFDKN